MIRETLHSLRLFTGITLAGILVLISLGAGKLSAQEFRSSLTGQVTDPSGAVVPNAVVTAVMNNTNGALPQPDEHVRT